MLYPLGTIMCFFEVGSSFDALREPGFRTGPWGALVGEHVPDEPCTTVGKGTVLLPSAEVVSAFSGVSRSPGKWRDNIAHQRNFPSRSP